MPKLKNHSGAKKRYRKTASGKFKFKKSGMQHLLTPSRSKRCREMRKPAFLNKKDAETMRGYLPYS